MKKKQEKKIKKNNFLLYLKSQKYKYIINLLKYNNNTIIYLYINYI